MWKFVRLLQRCVFMFSLEKLLLIEMLQLLLGPCKEGPGILDSNFKQTRDSGFKFQKGQDSHFKMAWTLESNLK